MKVFLIIIAVLAIIIALICSLSATLTLVYDDGWHTKLNVLFIEKDIILSDILSFILFPEKKAQEVVDESNEKKEKKEENKEKKPKKDNPPKPKKADVSKELKAKANEEEVHKEEKPAPKKSNPIKKIWDDDGVVGILELLTSLVETVNSAVTTLFKGLHIYSLYVMILVGGGDADFIARTYGTLCKYYYPLKGMILNGMRVDNYDDVIEPDYISPRIEFEFQLIFSINVGLLFKVLFKAGKVFVVNLIQSKKSSNKSNKRGH